MILFVALTIFLLLSPINAGGSIGGSFRLYKDAKKFYGCKAQIASEALFCPTSTSYRCFCSNRNYLATVAGCLEIVGPSDQATKEIILYCADRGFNVSNLWFNNSLRTYKKRAKTIYQIKNFKKTTLIHAPLILNRSEIENYQKTYAMYYSNFDDSIYYGCICSGYWVLILLISGAVHWTKILFPKFVKLWTDPVTNTWRRHVTAPAMFRKKKAQQQSVFKAAAYLIPSRAESLVVLFFYIVVSTVHMINAGSVPNERKYNSQLLARLRVYSDRAAIVSIMLMPLMILFAGRNNFLQWVVGLPYSTFITYHRHIARMIFGLIFLHGVGFSILFGNFYSRVLHEPYIRWGITAIVAGGIIMVQSMLYLRRRWYEIFLTVHVLLALVWTVGTLFHVNTRGYIAFAYPSVAIWIVDRLFRFGKLVSFGFPVAEVSLYSGDTLRVSVPKPKHWKPSPGGHAFIHFLRPSCFWQSHPFTFVVSPDETCIVFYCKIKGGITRQLCNLLDESPEKPTKLRVAVEGPYAGDTKAKYSDTAVFIAAGNGIPGLYSEVIHVAKKDTDQKLKLIWVVREWKSLIWFYDELLQLKETKIETTIYITKPEPEPTYYENEKILELWEAGKDLERLAQEIKLRLGHICFKIGRPVLQDLVRNQVEDSNGSIAFVACANHAMVDDIRFYCTKSISNPQKKRVDFYEQIQVWA